MIQEIFDKAILLEEGEELWIPCTSSEEQNSVRVNIYREKSKFASKFPEEAVCIGVSKRRNADKLPCVVIYKKGKSLSESFIRKPDGETVKVFDTEAEDVRAGILVEDLSKVEGGDRDD